MKPFWFPIEPAAFLSDSLVDQMTPLELGACFRLLCRQWIDGDLPDDPEQLRRLARLSNVEMDKAWEVIQRFFPESGEGKRANRYANKRRKDVEVTLSKRHDAAIKANEKRWSGDPIAIRNASESDPNRNPIVIAKVKENITRINKQRDNDDILDLLSKTIP